jgi:hypothetical protein
MLEDEIIKKGLIKFFPKKNELQMKKRMRIKSHRKKKTKR